MKNQLIKRRKRISSMAEFIEGAINKIESIKNTLKTTFTNKQVSFNTNDSLNTLVSKVNGMKGLVPMTKTLDYNYIMNYGSFKKHTMNVSQTTGFGGTPEIIITGRSDVSSGDTVANKRKGKLRVEFTIDLSYIDYIYWHAAKGDGPHGIMDCNVSDGNETNGTIYGTQGLHYSSFPTTWTEYSLDVRDITGVKVVTFVGGYTDSTGDPTSTSRYSNIRLVGYQTV